MAERGQKLVDPRDLDLNSSQSVFRDKRGRILWKTQGNNPETNLKLGINNIRGLVLSEIPELKDIPRDEYGFVEVSQRPLVESLLTERVRGNRAIRAAAVHSNAGVIYPSEYDQFGSSLTFTLATSFSDWGLFEETLRQFNEQTRKIRDARKRLEQNTPIPIRLVSNNEVAIIHPIDQLAGREVLKRILSGEVSPSEVQPIYVTDLRKRKHNPSVTFYLGKGIKDWVRIVLVWGVSMRIKTRAKRRRPTWWSGVRIVIIST